MKTDEIIEEITSGDTKKIRSSSAAIIRMGQNHDLIQPLIKYIPLIREKTKGLQLGGAFAPNQRFIDFAIRTLEFHKEHKECSCALYVVKYKLTNDVVDREIEYECFDPAEELKNGHIQFIEKIRSMDDYIDDLVVACGKCGRKFKVEERHYHYRWWKWTIID